MGDAGTRAGLVLLIHGDAAFAGEGIVQETLNLSHLPGYTSAARCTWWSTTRSASPPHPSKAVPARMPRTWPRCCKCRSFTSTARTRRPWRKWCNLALDFRAISSRTWSSTCTATAGAATTKATSPPLRSRCSTSAIEERKPVRESYLEHLLLLGEVTREEADRIESRTRRDAWRGTCRPRPQPRRTRRPSARAAGRVEGYLGGPGSQRRRSRHRRAARASFVGLLTTLTHAAGGFHPHPKIERLLEQRAAMARGETPLDWSAAEALALATLAADGDGVRLTGQDPRRGTFSQRHAVLHDVENGRTYTPLATSRTEQARFEIYNSPLSEGRAGLRVRLQPGSPGGLVMWEAQFGDFCNVAAGDYRPVHRQRRGKMAAVLRPGAAVAARFRGPGPEHSSVADRG